MAHAGTELEQVTDGVLAAARDEKGPGEADHLIDPACVVVVWRRSGRPVVRGRTRSRRDRP
jgi:hypothetical protein